MPSHDETEVPWHQDNSYWEPRLWSQQIFTAWVPLVDATPANGCMEYIRGSHKKGQTVTHTAGDVIFFGPTMVHRSIKNSGSTIRWSADLRWHQVGGPGAPPPPERAGGDELDFFYGLKNSLVIAEPGATVAPGSPAMDAWASIDRSEVQEAGLNTKAAAIDLDPIVTGPWMDIWNITHRNRHVDRYVASLPAAVRAAVDGTRTDL
ncbi:phytanoyl-CoA dioxygenase [Aureococcus anophagefferens]|nr:phytanoyl-CoA dioxygenase [Aureococcus anophagefferens]